MPRKGLTAAFMRAHTKIFTAKVAKNHFFPPWPGFGLALGAAGRCKHVA